MHPTKKNDNKSKKKKKIKKKINTVWHTPKLFLLYVTTVIILIDFDSAVFDFFFFLSIFHYTSLIYRVQNLPNLYYILSLRFLHPWKQMEIKKNTRKIVSLSSFIISYFFINHPSIANTSWSFK